MEIVEILDGRPVSQEPAKLRARSGWLSQLLRGKRSSRYMLEQGSVPQEILGWRDDFALLEIPAHGRPTLHVLPGMRGELRIGVSCMSVEQMLADPSLADAELGGARLPLPNGARLRIHCGPKTFVARVGGPPLMQTMQPAPVASLSQLIGAA